MTRKIVLLLAVIAALVTGPAVAASADSGKTPGVQQKVNEVMAAVPGGRQVSTTKVQYDGLTVTVNASSLALNCRFGHLCMTVRGTNFDFYYCRTWNVTNWYGVGPWINNQTPGTVARFYGSVGQQIWTSTAYSSGTADWGPVWSLKPC
ncbi:hypothetical protein GCM10020358_18820 [Amorphoplanes nipponensis]|uniref:Secreted protein n=1 Tax=Actinoplanes nipponensis TaxID=135950 RepID=A0A919JIW2_9ACTN|nr:hypothetical protein [Actinoplanes nipponensis]GIE50468.1 hypothetical protein Ani05nite_40020 [Actinoplanes nipponensis]